MVRITNKEINVFPKVFFLDYGIEGYEFDFQGENKTFYPGSHDVDWNDTTKGLVIVGKDETNNDISVKFWLEKNENGEIQKKVIDVIMN